MYPNRKQLKIVSWRINQVPKQKPSINTFDVKRQNKTEKHTNCLINQIFSDPTTHDKLETMRSSYETQENRCSQKSQNLFFTVSKKN